MKEVVLCGTGDHAKEVLSLLESLGFCVPYILDDEPIQNACALKDVPIRGPLSVLPDREDMSAFLAIADNQMRKQVARHFKKLQWVTLIHPAAWVDPSARLGAGTYIAAGAVVNAQGVLGSHVILGCGASVGHDCIVEDFASIESGVRLGGGARLCDGACCKIGSCVIPGRIIGARATLGPRAVATENVPAGETWLGVPAIADEN